MTYPHILVVVIGAGLLALVAVGFVIGSRWLDDRQYARTESKHTRHAPPADPVWDEAELADHDTQWGDELTDDEAAEWEDVRSAWAQNPQRTVTISLPPWPDAPITPAVLRDRYANFPGPVAPTLPQYQAGEPDADVDRLIAAIHENLPAAAAGVPGPGAHVLAPGGGGEPVLQGVVVDGPPDYGEPDYETCMWQIEHNAKWAALRRELVPA